MGQLRMERVQELVKQEISKIILEDIKDESSHLIRLGVSPHRSAILLPRIPSTIKISFSHRNTSSSPFRKHI